MARIGIVRQGYFPLDPRVRSQVEALIAAGHEVEVICLRGHDEPRYQRDGPLTVRRLSIPHDRGGLISYLAEYSTFLVAATLKLGWRHLRRAYDIVQVNTIPDSLVFAALIPRLLGARVLLDLHECMPEFFATKFKLGLRHPIVRLVAAVEQAAIRFSDAAMTCTEPMRRAFLARGASPEKLAVILNSYGLSLTPEPVPAVAENPSGRFVVICHGTVEERYGLDTLVRAVAVLKDDLPDLHLAITGDGSYLPVLRSLVRDLHVEQRVSFSNGWLPIKDVIKAIDAADVGVVAMKRDVFRDLTLCTKMFDFVGLRKPAIVSRTRSVEEYFDDSCFRMFTAGDVEDLAQAIRDVYHDKALRRRLVERSRETAEAYSWDRQRDRYLQIVDGLLPESSRTVIDLVPRAEDSGVAHQ